METTQLRVITTADAPFDDPTDSVDLVIRTADNVDFFVLSALLSLKSPSSFFRHVLQSNQHTEERGGLPVLEVKEDGDTFRIILMLCYPYSPEIKSIKQLADVGKALQKYCMDNAFERFVQTILASSLIREQALQVFVHALSNGWKMIGEAAARHTLANQLDTEVAFEDLKCIDAFQYVLLRDYHRRCSIAVRTITSGTSGVIHMPWLQEKMSEVPLLHPRVVCQRCGQRLVQRCDVGGQRFVMHGWVFDYLAAVKVELEGRPHPEIALGENIIGQAVTKSISQCDDAEWAKIAGSQIHRFATLVAEEIDKLISQVRR
ncbi:hypothetical protein F5146DRAFT_1082869 [Armillaria mellea]|nr:hypothetical protein F5146DRAFT_1082869 [Armillaria mellea]